jgi:indolepyruvate ferredoxin oxidoreductase alpha subunit
MGNAAAAYGALRAGVRVACGYPGTPSTECIETIAGCVRDWHKTGAPGGQGELHVEWSTNEKCALEVAWGAAISGARALFTCKQMGLNVAGDPMMTIGYLGVKAGLVLYVADDPGPISSQTEQDTRAYAAFAHVPVLDPSTPQEAYAMMRYAFELSEKYGTAVIVRPTTRICHSSAAMEAEVWDFEQTPYEPHPISGFEKDPKWVTFPPTAYAAHQAMPQRLARIQDDFCESGFNRIYEIADRLCAH